MARRLAGDETSDRGAAGLTGEHVVGNLLSDSGLSARGLNAPTDLLMARRVAVEEAIRIEETALTEVVGLLAMATPWVEWPERLRRALRAALTEAGEGVEAYKARWLRRHLFRDADPGWSPLPPSSLSPLERRIAERLRADLPGQTPLGCGSRTLAGEC